MGKGKGIEINLDFILRVVELILLVLAIVMFMLTGDKADALVTLHKLSKMQAFDAMCISCSIYIIILITLLGMKLIKGEELDTKFVGMLSVIGAILTIVAGIVVCIQSKHAPTNVLISGIMAIVGGAALVVESLKDFEVF